MGRYISDTGTVRWEVCGIPALLPGWRPNQRVLHHILGTPVLCYTAPSSHIWNTVQACSHRRHGQDKTRQFCLVRVSGVNKLAYNTQLYMQSIGVETRDQHHIKSTIVTIPYSNHVLPTNTDSTQNKQVLQQEAYSATWSVLTPKTRPSLGLSSQNRRKPVWDVAEPPCKILRRSVKPRLRNL